MTGKMSLKDRARDLRLRREFGITLVQYKAVSKHQGGKCAVCKRPATDFKNNLAVDHCHETGLVRGLLCWKCNKLVGVSGDDARKLKNASIYLVTPPATTVLGPIYCAPGRVGSKKRAKLLAALKAAKGKQ